MGRGDSPITIPWQGGLGNQLFQLAAGIAVSQRMSRPVRWTDYWLTHPAPDETPRSFALQGLLRDDELISAYTPRHGRFTDRLRHRRVVERAPDDDALARVGRGTRSVVGYLQRLSYVRQAWPELRRRFDESDVPAHRELLRPAGSRYGAVHYRLGDYVTNPAANVLHGVNSPDYFAEIVRDRSQRDGLDSWTLVSDDPTAAKELLRSADLPTGVTLTNCTSTDVWANMRALASASVCAISNSSFSWWAAFVGKSMHGTEIVAPRPWFDGSTPDPPILPEDWEVRTRRVLTGPHGGSPRRVPPM